MSAADSDALHDLPATTLLTRYRQGDLSPVEVTRAVLDHIARWEPHLCATYALDPEAAMSQAQASEARWSRGEPCGLLDGVPTMVKENIATRGTPTPLGTAAHRADPRRRGCAACGPAARGGCRAAGQDDDAGLRNAVVGPVELPSVDAQPMGPDEEPGGLQRGAPRRGRRRGTGRCTWAPTSAARCASRQAGAGSSRSSPASAASRSSRLTPAVSPGR